MATKSMAYDHPAYLVPIVQAGTIAAGSGTIVKFAAFSAMIVKNYIINPIVLSTSADTITAYQILAGGGTTNTHAFTTVGSAAAAMKSAVGTFTLAQGDELQIKKGTDATVTYDYAVEMVMVPGANLTV
jgi:DNA/RNA endonuclease YhcR with UshA esterase domain